MSFFSRLLIAVILASSCIATDHVSAQIGYQNQQSSVPIWQQIGNVNPYRQSQLNPVWQSYNRIQPVVSIRPTILSQHISNFPSTGTVNQLPGNVEFLPMTMPIEIFGAHGTVVIDSNGRLKHSDLSLAPGNIVPDSTGPYSGDGIISIDGQVVDADDREIETTDTGLEVELSLDSQNSPSDLVVANDALADSTNEELESLRSELETWKAENQIASVETEATAKFAAEKIEALRSQLEQEQEENQELGEQVEKLKTMIEGTIVDAIKKNQGTTDGKKTAKLVEDAVGQAKKEAAWEIASMRKKAELAQNQLAQSRQQAEQNQKELVQRLNAVEAELQNARSVKRSIGPDAVKQNSNSDSVEKTTLAKLALLKRQERIKLDSETMGTASEKTDLPLARVEIELEKQIRRVVGKIERRFKSKIARLSKLDNSNEEIAKLKTEMAAQMKKMEDRIRDRFKKRLEAAKNSG